MILSILGLYATAIVAQTQSAGLLWQTTDDLNLRWDGSSYLPVGVRVTPQSDLFAYALGKGVKDYILDLPLTPAAWAGLPERLNGARFIAAINAISPTARGVTVQPQWLRVPGLITSRKVTVPLPGSDSALVVLALKRDASLISTKRIKVENGAINFEVKADELSEQVALIYPIGENTENEDLWERFDEHRDSLVRTLQSFKGKDSLRGILNPLGQMAKLPENNLTFVPTSPIFRIELSEFLENKYKSLKTLAIAWSMTANDLEKFEDAARLVPLWTKTRGMGLLYDPDREVFIGCNQRRSTAWQDIEQVIANARQKRFRRLIDSIHQIARVPVIQEWNGWNALYENPRGPLDGISFRVTQPTPSGISQEGSKALSSILRWENSGWNIASDVTVPPESSIESYLEDLVAIGARGAFFRVKTAAEIDKISTKQLPTGFARPKVIYFPENATNPAFAQKLAGNTWWLPAPFDGNRIDFGNGIFAYQIVRQGLKEVVMWTDGERRRVTLLTKRAADMRVFSSSGAQPDPKLTKDGLDVTLGALPITIANVDEVPVPDLIMSNEFKLYNSFLARAAKVRRDVQDEEYQGRELDDMIKKNPAGAYALVTKLNRRLYALLGPTIWIEAESITAHDFSEVIPETGCSGSGALTLRTPFATEAGANTAKFSVPLKSTMDQEVWIAARIPAGDRELVSLRFGNQVMTIAGPPVSTYGNGFGWYRLGSTKFLANRNELTLQISSRDLIDLAIDALVITPTGFQPTGPYLPSQIIFDAANP